jgi:hypothetical protein
MGGTDEAWAAWSDAKDKVIDAAAAWHGYNEPRRAGRMTHEEICLYDAVTAMLAAGETMRAATSPRLVACPRCHRMVRLIDEQTLEAHTQPSNYDRPCHARWPNEHVR